MKRDIKSIVSLMTLEEKAGLCSGLDRMRTKPVERLGIPSIMMSDATHGLRKQEGTADHLGINKSKPATCFPTGSALASSWDRGLIEKVGKAIGEACQAEGVSIILGPAVNIKRSPLCGRNFEYLSEDPYLSSEMAAGYIKGVQGEGIGTSMKHYAVNNQEKRRMTVNADVDERALREIYLASFEGAVKKSKPWTVMCAYNQVNGAFCSENKKLLTSILKEEWGFEGFVMSDWGAVNERVDSLQAGLELEMPSSGGVGDRKIVDAVKSGKLDEKVLDAAVERILNVVFQVADRKKENASCEKAAQHKLAREVARDCMVLLKNDDNILPIEKGGRIALIGGFAANPRYQGGGSSHVIPTKVDSTVDEIKALAGSSAKVVYAEGFDLTNDETDEMLLNAAREAAKNSDVAVIFAGLPDRSESEGFDREHLNIPSNQIKLIEEIAEVQENIVVVLHNGSPVAMPWIGKVKAVLEAYLGGQSTGGAIADILFGEANPSGKLAETFPMKLSHNPSFLNFPGEGDRVEYREGIFVGYRYYEKKELEPLFPFGHGVGYTTFEYTNICLDREAILDTDTLEVKAKVKNTGKRVGKEIVQLYVKDVASSVIRPLKELKGFEKVEINPGEEKTVRFRLDKRAFAYYNVELKDWHVETGDFEILIGSSSKDIRLKSCITVTSTTETKKKYHRNSTMSDIMSDPKAATVMGELMGSRMQSPESQKEAENNMGMNLAEMMKDMPLRAIMSFAGRDDRALQAILDRLNA